MQKHSNNNSDNRRKKKGQQGCDNAKAEFIETTEIKAGVRRKDPSRDECKGDSKLAACTAAAAAAAEV